MMTSNTIASEPRATDESAEPRWRGDNWQSPLPKSVLKTFQSSRPDECWQRWVEYLVGREEPIGLTRLLPGKQSAVSWSLPKASEDSETVELIRLLHELEKKDAGKGKDGRGRDIIAEQISPWLAESSGAAITTPYAVQCVAWAWALDQLASCCPASIWWELHDSLRQTAEAASRLEPRRQPLESALLTGELPLALAYLFPEHKASKRLAADAKASLSLLLPRLLDGEGMPHASQLDLLRPLLGCWTRCRAAMEEFRKVQWSEEAEEQYEWLVTQALRMTRPDGAAVFAADAPDAATKELFDAALEWGGDVADDEVADHFLPGRPADYEPEEDWPTPAYSSEWSELAVLRTAWSRKARQLAVTYSHGASHLELCQAADVLLSGKWLFEITLGDRVLEPDTDAEWEEVAWESDKDVDYLELEMDVTPDVRIQRSFLLARGDDQFLLMADAVLSETSGPLRYRSVLPLAAEVSADVDAESREIKLATRKPISRVLPLALPEWRSDRRFGTLEVENHNLVLEQSGEHCLFAPLFLDLSAKRVKKPLTWRQLAVGEMRKNVSRDTAAGFRVQIGDFQWLVYRSLTPVANRTIIGQNLMCELHVSRFLDTGEVEELIEIE